MGIEKNIVIANPNAPTGTTLEPREIEAITESNPGHIVLIDEAYIDFGGKSVIPLVQRYENLLVVHTFSKSRSMAGARLAFAIGSASVIEDLNKMKYSFNPYNVNRLTQLLGEAALDEEAYFVAKRREIIATRSYTEKRLRELGFSMTDSSANFIFGKHPGIGGFDLYSKLKDMGVLVRQWNKPRISDYVRITIGTKEQMDVLLTAIADILKEKP
jgi:histidinol-phosphate aminotransferase